MAKMIYITGGARSGKSSFAESLLDGRDDVLYVATAIPYDEEMDERIAHHQMRRNSQWKTVERYCDFESVLPVAIESHGAVLIDCITIMVTNLMFHDTSIDWETVSPKVALSVESKIIAEVTGLIRWAESYDGTIILVSNETGMGIVPANPLSRWFRDFAGRVNQQVAKAADEVYLLISGIPMKIKGDV